MEQEINEIINNKNTIKDQKLSQKIELKIQQLENVTVPSVVLEYLSKEEDISFEMDDFKNFFDNFGEVLNINILDKKKCIVLFKTFFIAYICKQFLEKEDFYRDNKKKDFNIRWFNYENDHVLLSKEIKPLFEEIHKTNSVNIKDKENNKSTTNQNNNNPNNNNIGINMNMNINNFNINTTMNPNPMAQNQNMLGLQQLQYMQYLQMVQMKNKNIQNNNNNIPQGMGMMGMIPNYNYQQINQMQQLQQQNMLNLNMLMNKQNANNINNNNMNLNLINNNNLKNNIINQQMQQMNNPRLNQNLQNNINNQNMPNNKNSSNNTDNNNDDKNFGKYTCKYQILIANDKEFQIAKRLIGSKGCHMKDIINECKISGSDGESIKLRLRGQGSGHLEGPQKNKESDEPLHLCISSKNLEEMKKACLLVDKLLKKIQDEYIKYCEEKNIMPISEQIATRIDSKNFNFKGKNN